MDAVPAEAQRVQLWDSAADCGGRRFASFEVGPAVLMNDGSVFATGANACGAAHTAIFKGSWKAGPDFPDDLGIADGPAALEPNGKVLMMASPLIFQHPFDLPRMGREQPDDSPPGSQRGERFVVLRQHAGPSNRPDSFHRLLLRVGLQSHGKPTILPGHHGFSLHLPGLVPAGSYIISGHLFNGMSQGAAYGDDQQSATNYPLVRITNNATGHVFYSRTHDHSSMGVAFNGIVSTHFDVPTNQETGPSQLVVVANGIPSAPVAVTVQ